MVERLVFEPPGQLRVVGYTMTARVPVPLILQGKNSRQGPQFVGRTHRLDLTGDLRVPDEFLGWEAVFDLPSESAGAPLQLLFDQQAVWHGTPPLRPLPQTPEAMDRPPRPSMRSVPPVLGALLKDVRGPVLDFHCGSGGLVRYLRGRGVEADGLEIDAPGRREALPTEIPPHLRFYDGSLPLPFVEAAFATTTAIDVLQNLSDADRTLAELARVTREEVLVTVPHASSAQRLEALLKRHFTEVELYLLEPVELAGARLFTHLGARARCR